MPTTKHMRHPAKLHDRGTRMAVDARKDPETFCSADKRVADQLCINPETLRERVKKA